MTDRPDIDLTVRRALAQCGLVPLEGQVLLAHALGCERAWLAAHATDVLPRDALARFFTLAKRRRDGEPVAYLTGHREFWGLDLQVGPGVLIPRPETETLVEAALGHLPRDRAARVLDLGTGSGAIALALAHERPVARILGVDASDAALAIAAANARRLGAAHVRFARTDWYDGMPDGAVAFDCIVANPPYVALGDSHLQEGDLRFEPAAALASGVDGLDALRIIVGGAPAHLSAGGWLMVEHGHDQADAVRALLEQAGFASIAAWRDLAGIVRVAGGRRG